jgi:hypothetical protein
LPFADPVPGTTKQAGFRTRLPRVGLVIEHVVSVYENPVPVTLTNIPILPEIGFIVSVGAVTVNVVWAKSPVLPVTVMVYGPTATFPVVKLAMKPPEILVMMQDCCVTGVPDIVQVVSAEESVPLTPTLVEGGPEDGFMVIFTSDVTWNVACAESPIFPVTVIT